MKHVGIVFANTENADAMDYLKKSLENIFEEYVEFTLYYTELFQEDTILHEDAYLMEHEVPFEYLRHHVSDYTAIFALERSFRKEVWNGFSPFRKIPMCSSSTTEPIHPRNWFPPFPI